MIDFNPHAPTWLHIDLNSCFATIEQQANPFLRGKPIAVAAYTTPRGCILAPSVEAKRYGVKTGMQVAEGQALCPNLLILPSDPPKYRFVNRQLLKLLNEYSPEVSVKSIDEMLLNMSHLVISNPSQNWMRNPMNKNQTQRDLSPSSRDDKLISIAQEIKHRIKSEIGEWLTVSIGISTNPYLAKLAAGLHKPDGLDQIDGSNILSILKTLTLIDMPYIKSANAFRLACVGVKTPLEFYHAPPHRLKAAFKSIQAYYWYLRLHGHPIDEVEWQRKSIGHQYALPKATQDQKELEQLLCKLVEKMGRRLRSNHYTAQGIHLAMSFFDGDYYHHGETFPQPMYGSDDLFTATKVILDQVPQLKPVRSLAVTCFTLKEDLYDQLTLFRNEQRHRSLTKALDEVNDRWGEFSVIPGNMLSIHKQGKVLDRIAFGRVLDLDDVSLKNDPKQTWEMYND